MSIELEDPPRRTSASLVGGILGDLQHLLQQQLLLTRREVEAELWEWAAGAVVVGLGAATLLVAGVGLCLTLAHLLYWTVAPSGTDPASFPLWACYGLATAAFAVAGGILVQTGRARFRGKASGEASAKQSSEEPSEWSTHLT